jgi:hypothetical protein
LSDGGAGFRAKRFFIRHASSMRQVLKQSDTHELPVHFDHGDAGGLPHAVSLVAHCGRRDAALARNVLHGRGADALPPG